METELKMTIDAADIDRLRNDPLIKQYAVEPPYEQRLISTYFDTPNLDVRQRDASLRMRLLDGGQEWMQTLKGGSQVEAGLHQRQEWESQTDGPALDLAALRQMVDAKSPWGKLLRDKSITEKLEPIFTAKFTRTTWKLHLSGGEEIVCTLDQGALVHEETQVPISELELELKSGHVTSLYDLALALIDTVPMRIDNTTKADRGYALHAPDESIPAIPVNAIDFALSKKMTVAEGFGVVAGACVAHIQGNEMGVVRDRDPEYVHQMRVGLRRLHSALKLFEAGDITVPEKITEEFSWLGEQLGAARDWDVLSDSTLPIIEKNAPEDAELAALHHAAADVAGEKREQAAAAVNSTRYTQLMLTFARWLRSEEWRNGQPGSTLKKLNLPLSRFADMVLAQDQSRLMKRGARLQGADTQTRHRVRIAAKKTRYATEFFQSLYPSRRVHRYVDALSQLQDELGWMNDVVVADGLLKELQERKQDVTTGANFARGFLTSEILNEDRHLQKVWKRFTPVKPPCRNTV
jgi:triphosphatase